MASIPISESEDRPPVGNAVECGNVRAILIDIGCGWRRENRAGRR